MIYIKKRLQLKLTTLLICIIGLSFAQNNYYNDDIEAAAETGLNPKLEKFRDVINALEIKKTPLIEATNFDSFIEEGDYKNVNADVLQLDKIFFDYHDNNYQYQAISNYRIFLSSAFYTVIVTAKINNKTMETKLINYSLFGEIIDELNIAFDALDPYVLRQKSEVNKDRIVVTNYDWEEEEIVEKYDIFHIKNNGTIVAVSKMEDLIYVVSQQLKIADDKLIVGKQVAKLLPNNPSKAIVVIPEVASLTEDKIFYELNSHIVIADTETGKILCRFFESSKTNGWVSDAIALKDIKIDTAPYWVAENTRAFGIRVNFEGMSRANPYNYSTLSLFIESANNLQKILHNFEVNKLNGLWDTNCAGEFTEEKKILIITEEKTNNFYNILIKSNITNTINFENLDGECDYKENTYTEKTVLKFDGEHYK